MESSPIPVNQIDFYDKDGTNIDALPHRYWSSYNPTTTRGYIQPITNFKIFHNIKDYNSLADICFNDLVELRKTHGNEKPKRDYDEDGYMVIEDDDMQYYLKQGYFKISFPNIRRLSFPHIRTVFIAQTNATRAITTFLTGIDATSLQRHDDGFVGKGFYTGTFYIAGTYLSNTPVGIVSIYNLGFNKYTINIPALDCPGLDTILTEITNGYNMWYTISDKLLLAYYSIIYMLKHNDKSPEETINDINIDIINNKDIFKHYVVMAAKYIINENLVSNCIDWMLMSKLWRPHLNKLLDKGFDAVLGYRTYYESADSFLNDYQNGDFDKIRKEFDLYDVCVLDMKNLLPIGMLEVSVDDGSGY